MQKLWVDVVTTPWELARTGRVFRLLLASKIEEVKIDPWFFDRRSSWGAGGWSKLALVTGSPGQILAPATLEEIAQSTPLVQTYLPRINIYLDYRDHNEVERRALVQILALRIWQLRHDGRLPENLQELVTSKLLDKLPVDPYTPGRRFGYVRSSGQPLLPLGKLVPIRHGFEDLERLLPTANSWLLYSVGPDRQDDGAWANETTAAAGDIIFPLAESKAGGKGQSPH